MTRLKRRLVAIGTSLLLVLAATVGLAAPANAAVIVGVCTITVGEPHPSAHVNGMINSYGRVTCSVGMPNVHVRATLERSTGQTFPGTPDDRLNVSAGYRLQSTSAIPCAGNNGTYRTRVGVVLRAPAGYNPSYHSATYNSIWRGVACGVSRIAPTNEPSATVEAPEVVATLKFLDDGTIRESTPTELAIVEFIG